MIIATVIELLVKRALYRTLAGIRKTRSGGVSPETSPTHSSPATRLPLEVVETIIAYLAYDKRSLRACTLTCYSWYIVAVPYLYRTLTVSTDRWDRSKSRWPNPILRMHRLGLLPLVREFRVHGDNSPTREFSPKLLNCCILRQFSALSNVQVLEIEYLEIPKLIPRIRRYFRNFLPTVRSLILRKPRGTPRQIVYFVGIFQHLQDLELLYCAPGPWEGREGPADDPTLIPAFVPPLRGWLKMACVRVVGLLKAMIDLFGELRFRYMSLYEVDRVRLLLEACAETLEVVELDPTDPNGEQLSPKDMQASSQQFCS